MAITLARNNIGGIGPRKESTRALYNLVSRRYLEPAPFGATPLDKLRPSDVEALRWC